MIDSYLTDKEPLQKLPKWHLPEFNKIILPGLSIVSAGLVFAALPNLIDAANAFDYAKCALLAVSAGGVSYATNTLAIDRGARLAAIGSIGAAIASTTAILTVGIGLFGATYAGLVLDDIDQLKLEEFSQTNGVYIDVQVQDARSAGQIGSVLASIETGFAEAATCEDMSSCVSRQGNGGKGEAFNALLREEQKASAVVAEVSNGKAELAGALDRLLELQGQYQTRIADDDLSIKDKRIAASRLTAELRQTISRLREATPVALAEAYAASLAAPLTIADRPELSRKLNQIRSARAAELRSVIGARRTEATPPPSFPGKAGVSDTLSYIGHFLPIALIVGVVELVFPMLLWLTTFFTFRARIIRDETPQPPASPPRPQGRRQRGGRG